MAAVKVTIACRVCGTEFTVREKELQWRKPEFCSMACRNIGRVGMKYRPRGGTGGARSGGPKLPPRGKVDIVRPCETCGQDFKARNNKAKFCSRPCLYASMRREKAANWKGGRHLTDQGYARIYRPEHPKSDRFGYVSEHRFVVEGMVGRPLEDHETVHHINGIRSDNRPENLQLRSGNHGRGVIHRCRDCGSTNIDSVRLD